MAGYEGIPFAENLLDIAEWLWRKYGNKPIRQHLRETLKDMGENPHEWSRGLSHNVAGFDISRSVGFGRLFPGTEILANSQQLNANEMAGSFVIDMLGVTGHTGKFFWEMSPASSKSFSEAMRGAPGMAGNLWNAYEWSQHGVKGPQGGKITKDPKTGLIRDLTPEEVIGKAAGFNPTIVSQNREVNFDMWDQQTYWTTLASRLKKDVWRGVLQDDPELEREARDAIEEFNERVSENPESAKLRISNGDIARYLEYKRKRQRLEEEGRPVNRKFRRMYEDIRESYDDPREGN